MVADRFRRETTFRDCEEAVGAGQQRVRFLGADIGAFPICPRTLTLTEAWAWGREGEQPVDRRDSPRDSPSRRPSHAGKRRAWRRAPLGEEIRAAIRPGATDAEIQAAAERLLSLAAWRVGSLGKSRTISRRGDYGQVGKSGSSGGSVH